MRADGALLLGRLLLSVLFIVGGFAKLTAATATQAYFAKLGLPLPALAWLVAVVVELGGGLLLVLGLATRPVGVVLGVWCVATAAVAHVDLGDPAMRIQLMKNLAMAGGFAYVAAFGAGGLSLDGWRTRRKA